jgi:hypothetical protein
MFFRKDAELTADVFNLQSRVAYLSQDVRVLKDKLDIQSLRLDALMKAYPHGINKDGSPRKKIGRPHKKVTA